MVGVVVMVAVFGYLFRGASVWGTVNGPVQKVLIINDYDYRAVVEYRPQGEVAHLCDATGLCRALVDVPRDALVGVRFVSATA